MRGYKVDKLRDIKPGYILLGVMLTVIGILFISFQDAYDALALTMGIFLMLFGIVFGILTLMKRTRGVSYALKLALCITCIVCGAVTAITRQSAISVIANIFFLLLIVDGSFKLYMAIISGAHKVARLIMAGAGALIIIFGFLLAKFTPTDAARLSTLTGVLIILDGIINLYSAFFKTDRDPVVVPDKEPESEESEG